MSAVIGCNKMWSDHTHSLKTLGQAGPRDYVLFSPMDITDLTNKAQPKNTTSASLRAKAQKMSDDNADVKGTMGRSRTSWSLM